jgi:hypothetical protein
MEDEGKRSKERIVRSPVRGDQGNPEISRPHWKLFGFECVDTYGSMRMKVASVLSSGWMFKTKTVVTLSCTIWQMFIE